MQPPLTEWSPFRLFLVRSGFLFVLLFILSYPFGYSLIPEPGYYLQRIFSPMARATGDHLLVLNRPYSDTLVSDSTGFYINALNIAIISLLLSAAWGFAYRKQKSASQLLYWFIVLVRYYLALQLLIYGFSKVFKAQFYLPEPNTLYTMLGQVNKDLLFWSAMGVSKSYSIFLGCTEILAGILLLFRKTLLAGAIMTVFVLINITALNFAFDISVKLHSLFLLSLGIFLVAQSGKRLWLFLIGKQVPVQVQQLHNFIASRNLTYKGIKILVILLLLAEALYPYFKAGNFDDDKMQRPALHGAYNVETFVLGNDTLPPLLTDSVRWKRIFFHRHNYLIIQSMSDKMMDYEIVDEVASSGIRLLQPANDSVVLQYKKTAPDSMILEGKIGNRNLYVLLRQLDWRSMPALKKEFSWTID